MVKFGRKGSNCLYIKQIIIPASILNDMNKNKKIDPIPEHFNSIEEASDFWDTHDAGEYDKYLRPLDEKIEVSENLPYSVLLDNSIAQRLKKIAQKRGISLETLVNLWIEEKLLIES